MSDNVYKIIELTGTSADGVDQAIRNAVGKAAQTVHNINWFQVTEIRGQVSQGEVAQFQVSLKLGFRLD
ncbi:MAG: dodecin domain-containing protein [Burkholderiales bacterium]|nr:MAG: dodecin domain-containing protein [Burkholderiales bacterium]